MTFFFLFAENAGPAFEEFLKCIGDKVKLKGFEKYRAQLDNKSKFYNNKFRKNLIQLFNTLTLYLFNKYFNMLYFSIVKFVWTKFIICRNLFFLLGFTFAFWMFKISY